VFAASEKKYMYISLPVDRMYGGKVRLPFTWASRAAVE